MQNQNYQTTNYSSPAGQYINPATQPVTTTTYIQQPTTFPSTSFNSAPIGQSNVQPNFVSQTGVFAQPGNSFGQQPMDVQSASYVQPTSYVQPSSYIQPTQYNGNAMIPAQQGGGFAQQPQGGDIPLNQTAVSELELKKRLLDNSHETQMKYADMESDKQHKLEDKAEKQREKAAKWKGRHQEWLVGMHEKKAVKLEQKAHAHEMASEDYKQKAKTIETERKQYDPPQDDKKPGDKTAKKDDKKDEKKDDKKPADATKKDAPADATKKDMPAPPQTATDATPSQPSQSSQPAPPSSDNSGDVNRPKKAVPVEKKDNEARFQQDVSTAAIKYAQGLQQQQSQQNSAVIGGGSRQ